MKKVFLISRDCLSKGDTIFSSYNRNFFCKNGQFCILPFSTNSYHHVNDKQKFYPIEGFK